MNAPSEAAVVHAASNGVATLRLHRPERRNALNDEVLDELLNGLRTSDARGDAALVLTGGDDQFSAGGDIRSMPGTDSGVFGPASRLESIHALIGAMVRADVVTVAAVEGYAIGAAWGIVLACDVVVAAEDAYFAAPFAARGLTADAGTAFHLPRRLGHQRAAAHLYFGEHLRASDAHAAGLVTEVAAPSTATDRATELANRLAGGPRESNALTKSLSTRGYAAELIDFLDAERITMSLAGHGRDALEGKTAFLERREPDFR